VFAGLYLLIKEKSILSAKNLKGEILTFYGAGLKKLK